MARLRHTIVLTSVSRPHVERSVGVAHDVLESLDTRGATLLTEDGRPVAGVELRSGEHLRPGATYALVDGHEQTVRAEVLAWDRARETGARFEATHPSYASPDGAETSSGRVVSVVRLHSADRPERLDLAVDGALTRADGRRRRLRWFTLNGTLDLARWWQALEGVARGGAPGKPAFSLRMRHPVLRAAFEASPCEATDGTWRVEVVTMLRGRGLARPVAAVPLLVTRRMMHRAIGQALDRMADDWGTRVAPELNREPEELRRELTELLCRTPAA
ncbi:hypothetical protein [Streptomyces radicis]|uniref:Uncharacterized protein n=1 Tax=Streptomyces radicis TaxID=1750517 RepID=A0A3A9VW56_9ACTN|nr:hypothetical protein [Streptomyces radicis]RKN05221.1 hypothetical protein D7319_25975 [Streptomyces radicis]RKN16754.1 hypothetical protein D7318_25340 [Streptomyces radicis]